MKKERIIEKFAIGSKAIEELKVPANESKIQISESKTADVLMRVKHPIGIVDQFTANKTYYAKEDVEKGIKEAKEILENGGFGGYANHPDDDREADLLRTTHYTRDISVENGTQYSTVDIINTSAGRDLAVQLRTGRVGVSTRNFGVKESYKEGTAIRELELNGHDYVEVPSAGIYTNPNELSTESKKDKNEFPPITESKITDIGEIDGFDKSEKKNTNITGEVMEKLNLKKIKLDIKGLVKEAIELKPLQAIDELVSIKEAIEVEGLEDVKESIDNKIAEIKESIEKALEEVGKPDSKTDAKTTGGDNSDAGMKPDEEEKADKEMDTGVDTGEGAKGDNVDTKEKGVEAKKKETKEEDDMKDEDKKDEDKSDDKKDEDKDKKEETKEEDDKDKKDDEDKSDDKDSDKDKKDDEDKKDDDKKEETKEEKLAKVEKTLENVKTLENHIVESNKVIDDMSKELFKNVQYSKALESAGLKTKNYSQTLEAELLKAKSYIEKLENKVVEQDNRLKGITTGEHEEVSVVEHLENVLVKYPQLESFKEELGYLPNKGAIDSAVIKHLSVTEKAGIHASQFSRSSRTRETRLDLPNTIIESKIGKSSKDEKSYEDKVIESKLGKDYV